MDLDDRHLLRACVLGVHDESFSRQNVLFNYCLFPAGSVTVGTYLQISSVAARSDHQTSGRGVKALKFSEAGRKVSCKSRAKENLSILS